jgi:hypothetical protein
MAKNRVKQKNEIDELWLVLVVAIFIMLISIVAKKNDLSEEAVTILDELTDNNNYSFAPNNVLYAERFEKVSKMGYIELKNTLNVKNEFCIYFEDKNGNLIEIEDGVRSIGSGVIEINGVPCGK